ncbi:hypothetical protein DQM28_08295 [Leptospira mayottensis]|uniref:DUF1564 family protein n=1 Tax=Leptospira mayottensis TaxID=1137606 RepID=A0ABN5NW22_9LEPT|nr:hypothetical protein DQM28_08295 [Leptospira mayottensis]
MALEKTQCLASIGARKNSMSRFYWRSKKLNVSLLLALEKTQCLASIGARQVRYWLKGTFDSMVQ